MIIRRAAERGSTRLSWLDSRHSFSFANYMDPQWMGFGPLRVINQDVVSPGAGFSTHSHANAEIISYVLSGAMRHEDSMGNVQELTENTFQAMSAGSGVSHSEWNASNQNPLSFLQIWLWPDRAGHTPDHAFRKFEAAQGPQLVVSADGRDGSLRINQDLSLYRWRAEAGQTLEFPVTSGRGLWIQAVNGTLRLGDQKLEAGDGVGITEVGTCTPQVLKTGEWLLFDLPLARN